MPLPVGHSLHKARYLELKKTKLTIEVLKFSYTNITGSEHEKLSIFEK
jgi:hypothetical protein